MKKCLELNTNIFFFHEYLHYLQDILTSYGLADISKVLNCIKFVYHHVKAKEAAKDFILCRPVDFDKATQINNELFGHYLQYQENKIELDDAVFVNGIETNDYIVPGYMSDKYSVKEYKIMLSNGSNYMLGAHAINECICHLLEKRVYDLTCKISIPYDLPYLVWNYYFNYNQNMKDNISALLDLMEFSLQFFNPAEIFIETLDRMTGKKEPVINYNKHFYEQLTNSWKSSKNENSIDIYKSTLNSVIVDINGTLVSELYLSYRLWLLEVLGKAGEYKTQNEPIFSPLYNRLNKSNAKSFLTRAFETFGIPPVYNDDGVIYIKDIMEEKNGICRYLPYVSFFASQGIISVYECLRHSECGCNADLKEVCQHINDSTKHTVYEIDEKCDTSPWEKDDIIKMCPFMAVWKTFGLTNMQIL